jgi:hypothetical protein
MTEQEKLLASIGEILPKQEANTPDIKATSPIQDEFGSIISFINLLPELFNSIQEKNNGNI